MKRAVNTYEIRQIGHEDLPKGWTGWGSSGFSCGRHLILDAYGEQAKAPNSGLIAFAYLFRRFGPSLAAHDEYKQLAQYILTTADPEVWLTMYPTASGLQYSCGCLCTHARHDTLRAPITAWVAAAAEWLKANHGLTYREACLQQDGGMLKAAARAIGDIPRDNWSEQWRDAPEAVRSFNQALYDALRELLTPVFVRDVDINILGVIYEH